MKKTLVLLLALVLMFSVFGYTVSAADDFEENQGGYFVVGTMTGWELDERYQVEAIRWYDDEGNLEDGVVYRTYLYLDPSDAFKIVYSPNGKTLDNAVWYPEGEGNSFNQESQIVKESGYYCFRFKPDYKPLTSYTGKWYYDCIYCRGYYKDTYYPQREVEPGYYAVGTMTDWKLDRRYSVYGENPVALRMTDIFKIAYTEDGKTISKWYGEEDGKSFNEGKHIIWLDCPYYEIKFDPEGKLDVEAITGKDGKDKYSYKGYIAVIDSEPPGGLEPVTVAEKTDGLLYKDSFNYQYRGYDIVYYDELYYHKDENGENDWALVFATQGYGDPWIFYTEIANRIIIKDGWEYPFTTGFAVYDVKQDKFFDVNYHKYYGKTEFDPADYPGFIRAFDTYGVNINKYFNTDRLIGDLDRDYELTIIDATIIQRCDVKMCDWPEDDLTDPDDTYFYLNPKPLKYYSDFNRDGERDIVDATKLQRYVTYID